MLTRGTREARRSYQICQEMSLTEEELSRATHRKIATMKKMGMSALTLSVLPPLVMVVQTTEMRDCAVGRGVLEFAGAVSTECVCLLRDPSREHNDESKTRRTGRVAA